MRLALHIGTEKTATKSIQEFLSLNRDALFAQGVALSRFAIPPSNIRLPIWCNRGKGFGDILKHVTPRPSESDLQRVISDWEVQFRAEVGEFRHQTQVMIVTSEFFHSRVTHPGALARLSDLMSSLFDDVTIVCYCRDQASLLASAYSAAVQMGETRKFKEFSALCTPGNPYFDYDDLMSRWAEAFGPGQLRPRLFSTETFERGDIRRDFVRQVSAGAEIDALQYPSGMPNQRLSTLEQNLYVAANRLAERRSPDPCGLARKIQASIKQAVDSRLFRGASSHEPPDPARILDLFAPSNERFAMTYLKQRENPFSRSALSSLQQHSDKEDPQEVREKLGRFLDQLCNSLGDSLRTS